jgi:hypothetical protein
MSSALPSILSNKRQSAAEVSFNQNVSDTVKKNRKKSASSQKKVEVNEKKQPKQLSP